MGSDSPSSFHSTRVRGDVIDNLPPMPSGKTLISLQNCTVTSNQTGTRRRVDSTILVGSLTTEGPSADTELDLGHYAFARLAVTAHNDRPFAEAPVVGVALEHGTIEAALNADGYLDVLLPPGEHLAYACAEPPVRAWITVQADAEDAGIVRLQF